MATLREWIDRLRGTLRPGRSDADLEDELQLHLQMAAEDARRRGVPPAESTRTARLRSGGTVQAMDALRDQRGLPWLEDLRRDVRHGLRFYENGLLVRRHVTAPGGVSGFISLSPTGEGPRVEVVSRRRSDLPTPEAAATPEDEAGRG